MSKNLAETIQAALGQPVSRIAPLSGGCVGEVYRVTLDGGRHAVAKVDNGPRPCLDIEGYMLDYLSQHSALPVPAVLHQSPQLLVMEFLPGNSSFSDQAEIHAADLLASLHDITAEIHGLERDTLIGGLHQPNPWTQEWISFFRDARILAMGRQALDAARMDRATYTRLERFGEKLDALIAEPPRPALLHGDVWSANVLAEHGRITGFIDPAIYYGHPEIELAFITLFSTFGDRFFRRYEERNGIEPGFFEDRRDIYNLYPLLVHTRLFGGSYLEGVKRVLKRHGC